MQSEDTASFVEQRPAALAAVAGVRLWMSRAFCSGDVMGFDELDVEF